MQHKREKPNIKVFYNIISNGISEIINAIIGLVLCGFLEWVHHIRGVPALFFVKHILHKVVLSLLRNSSFAQGRGISNFHL